MLGRKVGRQENLFSPVRRETKVSRELRDLKSVLDFGWFREAAREKFCEDNGRPSIVPETLAAMMLLGYWFNIVSDRELCEECEDRLSFREFMGISDEDSVPVHSSLTHWRQRLGREVFAGFIEKSIEAAIEVGLVPGRCRMFDSTLVKAQADLHGPSTLKLNPVEHANDYLDALGDWEDPQLPGKTEERANKGSGWQAQDNGRKLRECKPIYVSSHDVEAKVLTRPNKKTDFYHKCHFEFDASSGLVMNADAEHVSETIKMAQFLENEERIVDTVAADTGYFTGESQQWLVERGITSYISVRDNDNSGGRVFGWSAFAYDSDRDEYICPAGERLRRFNRHIEGCARYRTVRGTCVGCEYQEYCFRAGKTGRQRDLKVSDNRMLMEEAKRRNLGWRYRRLKVRRAILCEGCIAHMKHYCGLYRARGIGEEAMAIQAAFAAAVLNLKKVLKFMERTRAAQIPSGALRLAYCVVAAILGSRSRRFLPLAFQV